MTSSDILQVAQGLAAGGVLTLVGINGNVVSVTSAGYLESVDTVVQGYLTNTTYGLSAIRTAIDGSGGLGTDLTTLLDRLTSTRAGYLDNLSAGAVAQASVIGTPANTSIAQDIADTVTKMTGSGTNSSYSYTAGVTEQTVLELAKTNIYSLLSLSIDLSNFTAGRVITARVYYKVDGVNYQLLDTVDYTVGTHDAISISPQMNLNQNWKITIQIDTTEAGATTVPFNYVLSNLT